jgi:hypothetical protein
MTLLLLSNPSARPNSELPPKRPNLAEFGGTMAEQPDKQTI